MSIVWYEQVRQCTVKYTFQFLAWQNWNNVKSTCVFAGRPSGRCMVSNQTVVQFALLRSTLVAMRRRPSLNQFLNPQLGRTKSRGRYWAVIQLSHRPEPSGRAACSPWGVQWVGHWRTTWSTVCSSARHSQAEEEAIPHLCKQEQKRPTPVREAVKPDARCSWEGHPGGWVLVPGIKLSCPTVFAFHPWSAQCTARMSSDELMSCCVASTNGCLDLRCRAFAPGGQVSAEWSRCPGSMARRARESVAHLRRNSGCWIPATCKNRKAVRWCRTQASSHNSQGVVDGGVKEAVVSTAATDKSAVLCS